ncbi:MAG: DUF5348 domain-containing protein [Paraclostridium sp.]
MNRGYLVLQDNGRFGAITTEFTCGSPIQAFIDGKLIEGRIEGRVNWENNGEFEYYLLADDGEAYSLKNGIEVLYE